MSTSPERPQDHPPQRPATRPTISRDPSNGQGPPPRPATRPRPATHPSGGPESRPPEPSIEQKPKDDDEFDFSSRIPPPKPAKRPVKRPSLGSARIQPAAPGPEHEPSALGKKLEAIDQLPPGGVTTQDIGTVREVAAELDSRPGGAVASQLGYPVLGPRKMYGLARDRSQSPPQPHPSTQNVQKPSVHKESAPRSEPAQSTSEPETESHRPEPISEADPVSKSEPQQQLNTETQSSSGITEHDKTGDMSKEPVQEPVQEPGSGLSLNGAEGSIPDSSQIQSIQEPLKPTGEAERLGNEIESEEIGHSNKVEQEVPTTVLDAHDSAQGEPESGNKVKSLERDESSESVDKPVKESAKESVDNRPVNPDKELVNDDAAKEDYLKEQIPSVSRPKDLGDKTAGGPVSKDIEDLKSKSIEEADTRENKEEPTVDLKDPLIQEPKHDSLQETGEETGLKSKQEAEDAPESKLNEPLEQPKETKDELKEDSKEESKEVLKEEPKQELDASQRPTKEEPKENFEEGPEEHLEEEPKEELKQEIKESQEHPKEELKEDLKEEPGEEPKKTPEQGTKLESKLDPKDDLKEQHKENPNVDIPEPKEANADNANSTEQKEAPTPGPFRPASRPAKPHDNPEVHKKQPPPRPAMRPRLASQFEQAVKDAELEKSRPKPAPRTPGSRVAGIQSTLFADLNSALSRGPPGGPRPKPPKPTTTVSGSDTSVSDASGLDALHEDHDHSAKNTPSMDSAETQIKAMPPNPRARARGPRRRLPDDAKPKFTVTVAEIWNLPEPVKIPTEPSKDSNSAPEVVPKHESAMSMESKREPAEKSANISSEDLPRGNIKAESTEESPDAVGPRTTINTRVKTDAEGEDVNSSDRDEAETKHVRINPDALDANPSAEDKNEDDSSADDAGLKSRSSESLDGNTESSLREAVKQAIHPPQQQPLDMSLDSSHHHSRHSHHSTHENSENLENHENHENHEENRDTNKGQGDHEQHEHSTETLPALSRLLDKPLDTPVGEPALGQENLGLDETDALISRSTDMSRKPSAELSRSSLEVPGLANYLDKPISPAANQDIQTYFETPHQKSSDQEPDENRTTAANPEPAQPPPRPSQRPNKSSEHHDGLHTTIEDINDPEARLEAVRARLREKRDHSE